jgi:hypothetical protein
MNPCCLKMKKYAIIEDGKVIDTFRTKGCANKYKKPNQRIVNISELEQDSVIVSTKVS